MTERSTLRERAIVRLARRWARKYDIQIVPPNLHKAMRADPNVRLVRVLKDRGLAGQCQRPFTFDLTSTLKEAKDDSTDSPDALDGNEGR